MRESQSDTLSPSLRLVEGHRASKDRSVIPMKKKHLPLLILLALTIVVAFGSRIAGPSDLTEKTQPKTIAYTADMLINGRWVLPRHVSGQPTTKPPLYNWASVVIVGGLDVWDEWALKFPSIVSGLSTVAVCIWMTQWMRRRRNPLCLKGTKDEPSANQTSNHVHSSSDTDDAMTLGIVSGVLLLAGYPMYKQIYIARPDMMVTAFVVGSWLLATVLLDRAQQGISIKRTTPLAMGMWLCIGAAALTKGPPALLTLLYLPLASKLIYGRWSLLRATGWWWGLPLATVMIAAWAIPAYRLDPDHVRDVLVSKEVVDRVIEGGPLRIVAELWKMPGYFVIRYLPWSVLAIIALLHIPLRSWMNHQFAPAILWLLVVLAFFSSSSGKISRYLLPLYPAAAALAAYVGVVVWARQGCTARRLATAGLIVAIGMGVYQWTVSVPAKTGLGDHHKAFVAEIQPIVGDDPIVFLQHNSQIVQTLLARHQAGKPSPGQLQRARWAIDDYFDDTDALVVSETVIIHNNGKVGRIALYPWPKKQRSTVNQPKSRKSTPFSQYTTHDSVTAPANRAASAPR